VGSERERGEQRWWRRREVLTAAARLTYTQRQERKIGDRTDRRSHRCSENPEEEGVDPAVSSSLFLQTYRERERDFCGFFSTPAAGYARVRSCGPAAGRHNGHHHHRRRHYPMFNILCRIKSWKNILYTL
jgi:hypothetical protein